MIDCKDCKHCIRVNGAGAWCNNREYIRLVQPWQFISKPIDEIRHYVTPRIGKCKFFERK